MNGFYWIYLAALAMTLAWSFAGTPRRRQALYWSAWAFLLVLFVAQDDSVSIDIAEYMRQWAIIPTLTLPQMLVHKFEIGFVALCWVLERLFASDRVLLLAMGVLILAPFAASYDRESPAPMVAMMAFLALGMYLHAIIFWRQLAAMAILTCSYRYLYRRQLWRFLAVVLLAMTFHKISIVFVGVYIVYRLPVNRWLLLAAAGCAVVLGLLAEPIIELGIELIYPRYRDFPRLVIGGKTLLAMLWVVVGLSYWLLRDKMDDDRVRLPFFMVLIAAAIQPVCFAFYNWLRIVLIFRVALAPLTAQLYLRLFEDPDNPALLLLRRRTPGLHRAVMKVYRRPWFRAAALVALFAVLFVWYGSELDGAVYVMAPIV